jgi:CelD/BcsL family acetyltransferase involved in cellulose biosynthesis
MPILQPMTVELHRTEAAFAALRPEWDELAAGIVPWNPFITPDWLATQWAFFRRRSCFVRDMLHCYTVRAADGRLVAVAPMQMSLRPGFGPLQLRQLCYLGADPNVTEIRGIVCHAADEPDVVKALATRVLAARESWDIVHWGGLREESGCDRYMATAGSITTKRNLSDFYIELPENFAALRAGLPRNMREALRKCYNALNRDGHDATFDVITDPHCVDAALDRFFDLHTARARAGGGVAHADTFADQKSRAFLRAYARHSAQRGELRIFRLQIDGDVVAMRIGFCSGEDLYLYYSGYLPPWGRYSVMTRTVAEALKWAMSVGLKRVNLSFGRDRSKLRWRPVEIRFHEAIQPAPNWRGRLSLMLLRHRAGGVLQRKPAPASRPT